MGLRDRLKERLKGALGFPPPAAPAPPPAPAPTVEPDYSLLGAGPVPEGAARTWPLPGSPDQVVAVFRRNGELFAMDNACAHEDGPIGEGSIRGTTVRCPYHDWEYDFTTGACLTDPERRQSCWKVREVQGQIWLGPLLRQGTTIRGGEHNDGMEVIQR